MGTDNLLGFCTDSVMILPCTSGMVEVTNVQVVAGNFSDALDMLTNKLVADCQVFDTLQLRIKLEQNVMNTFDYNSSNGKSVSFDHTFTKA